MKRLISLLLTFTMVLSLFVCTTAFADEAIVVPDPVGELKNVALNKPVWCGGWYNDPSDTDHGDPSRAVDENDNNCFVNGTNYDGTTYGKGLIDGNNYLVIDLRNSYKIEKLVFNPSRPSQANWANVPAERDYFDVQFSNDKNFEQYTTVYSVTDALARNEEVTINPSLSEKFRYIRFINTDGTENMCFRYVRVYSYDVYDTFEDDQELVLINLSTGKTDAWSRGSYYDWSAKYAFDGTSTPYHCGSTDDGGGGGVDLILNGVTYKYFAVNLEKPYLINNISWGSRGTNYGENIDIIVDLSNSRDFSGEIYTAETNSTGGDGSFTFDAEVLEKQYQYVRFRTTSNFYITEMNIFGYDAAPIVTPDPVDVIEINSVYLINNTSGDKLWLLPDSNTLAAKINYSNFFADEKQVNLYWVAYSDDDLLIDVDATQITLNGSSKKVEEIIPLYVANNAKYYKLFVWSNGNKPYIYVSYIAKLEIADDEGNWSNWYN